MLTIIRAVTPPILLLAVCLALLGVMAVWRRVHRPH